MDRLNPARGRSPREPDRAKPRLKDGAPRSSWLQLGPARGVWRSPIWTCLYRWASYPRF